MYIVGMLTELWADCYYYHKALVLIHSDPHLCLYLRTAGLQASTVLCSFRDSITYDKSEEGDPNEPLDVGQPINSMWCSLSYSQGFLETLGITRMGLLQSRSNFEDALSATISLGEGEHWSSQGFYHHLELFENTTPIVVYFVTTS